MTEPTVFGHPTEPSPGQALDAARRSRARALSASRELLGEAEHRPGDHARYRASVERHEAAVAVFDAALLAVRAPGTPAEPDAAVVSD